MDAEMTQRAAAENAWRCAAEAEARSRELLAASATRMSPDRLIALGHLWAAVASQLEFVQTGERTSLGDAIEAARSTQEDWPDGTADTEVIRISLDHEFVPDHVDGGHCAVLVGGEICGYLRAAHVTPGQGGSPGYNCWCGGPDAFAHPEGSGPYCGRKM